MYTANRMPHLCQSLTLSGEDPFLYTASTCRVSTPDSPVWRDLSSIATNKPKLSDFAFVYSWLGRLGKITLTKWTSCSPWLRDTWRGAIRISAPCQSSPHSALRCAMIRLCRCGYRSHCYCHLNHKHCRGSLSVPMEQIERCDSPVGSHL